MAVRHIYLSLQGFAGFGDGVRAGIARFALSHPGWSFEGTSAMSPAPDLARQGDIDGFLGALTDPGLLRALVRQRRPAVQLFHHEVRPSVPAVYSDDEAIGRLAAEHLLEAGFRHVAFLGQSDRPFSNARARGATTRFAEAGVEAQVVTNNSVLHGRDWKLLPRMLAAWLSGMPTPLGLIAAEDNLAHLALQAALAVGRRVPDDVAIVGINDALLTCAFANPPLTSVTPDWHRIGYEGAALLGRLMDGESWPDEPLLIPPVGISVRASSDVLAIDDAEVAAALAYIRTHAEQPLNVADVVQAVPAARRSLERKFRQYLGRSPWQEIRRSQIAHVKQLLIGTDWSMPRIAAASAFRDARDLSTQFRKHAGETPTGFRRRHRTF
ncbi:MAG: substrate-binding domain-containing protein [Phycisphaeraceae bacterium]